MESWQAPGYGHIVRAHASADGRLTAFFADSTWVEIDGCRLLPPEAVEPRWSVLGVDEYGDFLLVPTAREAIDIPADRIRVVTDPAFAEHRAAVAHREARRIGRRIRELRQRRGLTERALAKQAGITAMSMSRIELGHHDVVLTTLAQILAAMGCSFDDLEISPLTPDEPVGESSEETVLVAPSQTATNAIAAGNGPALPSATAGSRKRPHRKRPTHP